MNDPLVSVVIPTYGRSHLLSRAIESVLSQTYSNVEIFVVDDNGRETPQQKETEEKLLEYIQNNLVTYLKHENNAGGSAARNTGIKASSGDYIALLDDDDEWFPQKLEKQIEYFKSLDENVGVIYCSYILQEYDSDVEIIRSDKGNLTKELLMLEFDPGASSTLVFKKSVLEEIHYFDENFARHQDIEILIRLCRHYFIDVCPDVLLKINGHNFPSASKIEVVKKLFFDLFKPDISEFSFVDQRKIYAKHYIELATLFLNEKRFVKLLNYYFISVVMYPPVLMNNKVNMRMINFIKKRVG